MLCEFNIYLIFVTFFAFIEIYSRFSASLFGTGLFVYNTRPLNGMFISKLITINYNNINIISDVKLHTCSGVCLCRIKVKYVKHTRLDARLKMIGFFLLRSAPKTLLLLRTRTHTFWSVGQRLKWDSSGFWCFFG